MNKYIFLLTITFLFSITINAYSSELDDFCKENSSFCDTLKNYKKAELKSSDYVDSLHRFVLNRTTLFANGSYNNDKGIIYIDSNPQNDKQNNNRLLNLGVEYRISLFDLFCDKNINYHKDETIFDNIQLFTSYTHGNGVSDSSSSLSGSQLTSNYNNVVKAGFEIKCTLTDLAGSIKFP